MCLHSNRLHVGIKAMHRCWRAGLYTSRACTATHLKTVAYCQPWASVAGLTTTSQPSACSLGLRARATGLPWASLHSGASKTDSGAFLTNRRATQKLPGSVHMLALACATQICAFYTLACMADGSHQPIGPKKRWHSYTSSTSRAAIAVSFLPAVLPPPPPAVSLLLPADVRSCSASWPSRCSRRVSEERRPAAAVTQRVCWLAATAFAADGGGLCLQIASLARCSGLENF